MSATKLYGLVLAGGKSTRMGNDKGEIRYYDEPQRLYAYNLLNDLCDQTFLSIREDQQDAIDDDFNVIVDKNHFRGPYNGIISAHENYPKVAWLVLATDLPLLNKKNIEKLIKNRNPKKIATAYATNESKLPEPLIAIWEPESLRKSKKYLNTSQGTCPRKFLINNDVQLVFPEEDRVLMNANTVKEFHLAIENIEAS